MKKVLVITTSLRHNSNSDALAESFVKGAQDAGNSVETVTLKGKNIQFCKGCMACQKKGECVIKDDANSISKKMYEADVIAFATPIYYYEMSGQMKTLLDRANWLYSSDYHFKDIYVLSTAAEDEKSVPDRCVNGVGGWIACFERARLAGSVFAGGVDAAGEIKEHKALKEAYDMGRNV